MDFCSLLSNDEVNAVILSREFAIEMEKMFAMDLAESEQIQWEEWKKRPLLPRIREWFAHLFVRLVVKLRRRSVYYSKSESCESDA